MQRASVLLLRCLSLLLRVLLQRRDKVCHGGRVRKRSGSRQGGCHSRCCSGGIRRRLGQAASPGAAAAAGAAAGWPRLRGRP